MFPARCLGSGACVSSSDREWGFVYWGFKGVHMWLRYVFFCACLCGAGLMGVWLTGLIYCDVFASFLLIYSDTHTHIHAHTHITAGHLSPVTLHCCWEWTPRRQTVNKQLRARALIHAKYIWNMFWYSQLVLLSTWGFEGNDSDAFYVCFYLVLVCGVAVWSWKGYGYCTWCYFVHTLAVSSLFYEGEKFT